MQLRHVFRLTIVSLLLVVFAQGPATAGEATWKVGTATAKITPKKSMWLSGYGGRNHPSEGTLHDLWIKVLVLQTPDGQRGVVLTSDLLGFPKGMYEDLVAAMKERFGLQRAQIMLTTSHSHTSPVLRHGLYDIYPLDDRQRALIEEYSAGLEKTIVATVAEALKSPTPATLAGAEGTCTFAVNRRNNPAGQVPQLREQGKLRGPSDHGVSVLAVKSPDKKLRAVLFGYACHCTTLSSYQWSGDYAGFAQLAFQEKHPGVQAMFYAGCGADQNPLPRRSVELCEKYGRMLATSVDEVLDKPMRPIQPGLRMAIELVDLPFERNPTKEELQAAAARGGYQGRWGKRLLAHLEAGRKFPTSHPLPIQVWRLGADQLWITIGGEVVVDYSLMFKKKYGPRTWVAGYTNDVMAYIPSDRVWKEGGYESGAFRVYGLPTDRWKEGIQERITAAVGRLVKKVNAP